MSTSVLWPYMVKGLGRGTYGLGLGLGLEILALTTSLDISIVYAIMSVNLV